MWCPLTCHSYGVGASHSRSIEDICLKNQDHQEKGCECQEKSFPSCA